MLSERLRRAGDRAASNKAIVGSAAGTAASSSNERSDGVLNRASLPSDIIAFVVFCRLRYRLTLRDLSEIMLLREFTVSHECIRRWEAKPLPVMGEVLRKRRRGTGRSSGQSWYVDETYLKVHGRCKWREM